MQTSSTSPVQVLAGLLGPLVILSVAGTCLGRAEGVPAAGVPLVWGLPYLVLGATGLLASRFHSSRMLFSVALLGAGLAALQVLPAEVPMGLRLLVLGVLLPLDLAVLAWVTERGIATAHGVVRLALLLGQGLLVWSLRPHLAALAAWPPSMPHPIMPWLSVATVLLSGIAILYRMWRAPSALESGALGMLAALVLALTAGGGIAQSVWVLTGGLIGLISLIQFSYGLAFLDELTGLPARRALRQQLAGLSGRYTIAMVVVDHFKNFNDTYGHDVGDQCLRMVASRLARVTDGGRAYRYGGEEFTVLFPGKTVRDAWDALEELRLEIETHPMVLRGPDRPSKKPKETRPRSGPLSKVTVTVSIGVAERGDRSPRPDDVLKAADKALYKAKKKGRNQVCR
ncbi:MAG: GGDEF domain-containing protein [Candidatus Xenobia bacterium]